MIPLPRIQFVKAGLRRKSGQTRWCKGKSVIKVSLLPARRIAASWLTLTEPRFSLTPVFRAV